VQGSLVEIIRDRRDELGESLRHSPLPLQMEDGKAHLWTFAGGRINQTLRYAFVILGDFKVVADNFQLRIEGDRLTVDAIKTIMQRLREADFWTDQVVWQRIMAALPEYRLSKFQRALPPQFSQEMVGRYLLDIEGAKRLMSTT
jgi:ATP-dependent Lhr-like helicase